MGSLRNPAGWNHVFGLRPSQGRVPMSPAQDVFIAQLATEGPMARHVADLALLLSTQAGAHPSSPLSLTGDPSVFAGTLEDMSRKASSKKATAMCEACDEGIVTVATCLSGNQKLCEMCDLAEWAAGLCSSCGDLPVTREQPLCSAQLCDVCDLSLWVVRNGFV
jgi:hypothetical protein